MKISILELLWIIFIVLKIIGVITWSWLVVCSPIIAEIVIIIILYALKYYLTSKY